MKKKQSMLVFATSVLCMHMLVLCALPGETQTAESEGNLNWGKTVSELRTSISLNQTEYKIGDKIIVELTFQNTSNKPCYLYLSRDGLASCFLITNEEGEAAKKKCTVIYKLGSPKKNFHLLPPNKELKFNAKGRVTISDKAYRHFSSIKDKKPVVISFFDIDHTILNPGRFKITYQYEPNKKFVTKIAKKFGFKNTWLGTLDSNSLEFDVRFSTQKEIADQIDRLKEGDQKEKAEAIKFLKANLELKSIPYLIEILKGKNYGLRKLATDALIKFKDKSIIPQLLALYKERKSSEDQIQILMIIFNVEDNLEKERKLLIKLIDSTTSLLKVKRYAINQLGSLCLRYKESADISLLLGIAKNKESLIRRIAAYQLGSVGQSLSSYPEKLKVIIDRLVEIAKDDMDGSVRATGVRALSGIMLLGNKKLIPDFTPVFIESLKDKDSSVRRMAARALGNHGDKNIIPILEKFIEENKDKWEIERAQQGIEKIKFREALKQKSHKE